MSNASQSMKSRAKWTPLRMSATFGIAAIGWLAVTQLVVPRLLGLSERWAALSGPLNETLLVVVCAAALYALARRFDRDKAIADRTIARRNDELRAIFGASPEPTWIYDLASHRILRVNQAAIRRYGFTEAEFLAMTVHDIRPAEDRQRFVDHSKSPRFELGINRARHRTKNGDVFHAESRGWNADIDGRDARLVVATDITERLANEHSLRLAQAAFDSAREAILITSERGALVAVNPALLSMTGYRSDECVGRQIEFLCSERHDGEFHRAAIRELVDSGHWQREVWARRKDGSELPVWLSISAVRDDDGRVRNYIGFATDMSDYKDATDRIEHLVHYDHLTLLPNRALLAQRLDRLLATRGRSNRELALLIVDLDHVGRINDSLGHAAGDALLRTAADRISKLARDVAVVGRWGGDEFVIVHDDAGEAEALRMAENVVHELALPCVLEGNAVRTTASVGVSICPRDGADGGTLLRNASTAVHHAKEHGGHCVRFFRRELDVAVRERHALENSLRLALARDEFEVHYQPQVRLADSTIAGVEALLRWHSPRQGMVAPDKFIPIAEGIGLMDEIGAWVLRTACRDAARWRAEGLLSKRVSVNVSAAQLKHAGFVETVEQALAAAGLAADMLELEITESVVVERDGDVRARLDRLMQLGVCFAIDDFGTGYSSFGYLQTLPVQALKIDGSFVHEMLPDPKSRSVPAAIIGIGRSFGLRVVAEGVETFEQQAALVQLGCDAAQGHLFAKPMPADEAAAWMRERNALIARIWSDVHKAA